MAANPNKPARRDLKRFGWQGINLSIPTDWELVSTGGSYRSGYAGLADQSAVRLEMKWDSARGEVDPSETAARYIQVLRKKAKKNRADIKIKRDLKLATLKGKQIECYEWSAGQRGIGMVSFCDQCRRMVHLVIMGRADRPLRGLCRTVFAALKDHPEDGRLLWDFYDMQFRSPEEMPLERQDLKTGCIRMPFGKGRSQLEFVRVSLATFVLAGKSLREWFEEFYSKVLKRWRWEVRETEVKGHRGLRLEARASVILSPGRLIGRGRQMRAACWQCEASNRLFIVRHSAPGRKLDLFEQALESFKCCQQQ